MNATVHPFPLGSASPVPPRDDRDWITRAELTQLAGITPRRTDYWTRTGLLVPLDDGPRGSGHLQRYDPTQADRATAIRELLDAGLSLETVRHHLDEYLTTGHIVLGQITLTRNTKEHQSA